MKNILHSYIKQRSSAIIMYTISCAVFAAVFYLYNLPLAAVAYPAMICAVLWIIYAIVRCIHVAKKHRILSSLTEALTEDMFPAPSSVDDSDYQRIIMLLQDARKMQDNAASQKYNDMIDYYTLWAHQIKTPIAAMRLTLQNEDSTLSRRLKSDLSRVERYVEMVLAYLRLDGSSSDYVLREYELDNIIRGAVKKFSGEFIDRHLSLDLKPTGMRVLTDEKWLSFVLEQLLSNALKYTPEGKISVYSAESSVLCISDTGIGIAAEDLPRIFEHGFTGYNGREDKHASGLGLYLCRRILNKLGHSISAKSEPGKGTTMSLDLSRKKITVE